MDFMVIMVVKHRSNLAGLTLKSELHTSDDRCFFLAEMRGIYEYNIDIHSVWNLEADITVS